MHSSIALIFRNEFNKLNNTGAHVLDSMYHMALKLLRNLISGVKNDFVIMYAILLWTSFHNAIKICIPLLVYRF